MPRLPTVDDLGARPVPQSRRSVVSVRNAGVVGEALSGVGQTVADTGFAIQEKEDRLSYAAAKAKLLEADVAARRELENDPDYETYESRYTERMGKAREEAAKLIRSKSDRSLFDIDTKTDLLRGSTAVASVAQRKRTDHRLATGYESLAVLERTGLDANDEPTRMAVIQTADDVIKGLMDTGDLSEVEAGNLRRKFIDNHLSNQIGAKLQNGDIGGAKGLLGKYRSMMSADTILKVDGLIQEQDATTTGMAVATEAFTQTIPSLFPTDIDRAFNVAVDTESNHQQFDRNGKPLTSSAGAVGIAQVMPDTGPEAAKLAGLPWDEKRYRHDAAYNYAIGKAYFKAMLNKFGNLEMAYAAYNAGPGAVQKAAAKGGDWLSALPAETQNYVAKNMREYGAGMGAPRQPTLIELQGRVRADPRIQNNPVAMKAALTQIEALYRDAQASKTQVEDEATAGAMEWLEANGGRYSQMPLSLRSRVPVEKRDTVMNYAQKLAKGDDTSDPAVYVKLAGDDQYLSSLSDQQFYQLRPKLSESDFKQFAKERGKLRDGGGAKSPETVDRASLNAVLDDRLTAMGIDPSPSTKASASEKQRVAAIKSFVRNDILRAQLKAGHKFSDAEIEKHVDGLFAKSVNMTTWGMFGLGEKTAPRQMITMRERDIPDDIRTKIKTGLKQRGVEPTEGAVLGVYWDWKRKRGG